MQPKTIYLLLCVVGTILPYWFFIPWLIGNGFNIPLLLGEIFASRISSFFWADVAVSAVVVLVFAQVEHTRRHLRYWWVAALAVVAVGVSLGLPLLLYLREREERA